MSLFNHGLYHECHDALEPLWAAAEGDLKDQLQGLILLAGGYHHLQLHNRAGMVAALGGGPGPSEALRRPGRHALG